ncbi:hypothetical protein KEM48_003650 [Puccinia striiformis f. sp. tritici PST-130]|nr:hypothetical protein KEM48_003650 [Puccinia striiformis f. sp. tritici PST-130]
MRGKIGTENLTQPKYTAVTYDLYGFTNVQNGKLLGFIGILSSILQGGYTRRSKKAPLWFVRSGLKASMMSLIQSRESGTIDGLSALFLYSAAAALAFVSASVVNSLNTLASLECDEEDTVLDNPVKVQHEKTPLQKISRGKALGDFRSAGQLGRAFGPLFATGLYWTKGPSVCYSLCAIGTFAVFFLTNQFSILHSRPTSTHHLPTKKLQ